MSDFAYSVVYVVSELWDIVFQGVLLFLIYRLISTVIKRTSTEKQLPDYKCKENK